MARILVMGPAHTPQDRGALDAVAAAVRACGHDGFTLPPAPADGAAPAWRQGLERADAVVAVLDGTPPDPVTTILCGLAHGLRRPVLGLRSDSRALPEDVRLHLAGLCKAVASVDAWTAVHLQPILAPFLAGARVFAGTLVRDAVPQILEKEGRPLRFRTVDRNAYPGVLKRKLVETAQRLEETDFGVEQEEIADLLEALETLINLRSYDRESLRSIKEGKWRRRGGFERGLLLDEEPAAAMERPPAPKPAG